MEMSSREENGRGELHIQLRHTTNIIKPWEQQTNKQNKRTNKQQQQLY